MKSEYSQIISLRLCMKSRAPMREVTTANLITGQGIEGDRHLRRVNKIEL